MKRQNVILSAVAAGKYIRSSIGFGFSRLLPVTVAITAIVLGGHASLAQPKLQDRINRKIEAEATSVVRGNVHPFANARFDRGEVGDSFRLERVTIMFKSTPAQEGELESLLTQQQDPNSPNYHHWLTPEEFAQRFGLSANDIKAVSSWLGARGFTINEVGRSGRSITFSGSAGHIKAAFQTSIHAFNVNGKNYYGNMSDPLVPAALADVILGFRSLNNFVLRPRVKVRSVDAPSPQFTSTTSGAHYIVPSDIATIYDLARLYASGIDGRGQTIAIAGQTDILLSDIDTFRRVSGLPPNDPEVVMVPGESDPGTNTDDLAEADLDIEWAGAVAPNAHIVYVNSNDVMTSLQYAVDQHLAPVVSITYGDCENNFDSLEVRALVSIGQQANAQGMTVLAAAGDSGAADCDSAISTHGLSVDLPASLPYVTSVGGTEFRDAANSWSAANNSSNGSALAYIPEVVWNDTAIEGQLAAGGGGKSAYFSKPSWQAASGVPDDGARDVPDLSLDASADHDGYLLCSNGSCVTGYRSNSGTLFVVGGTSVSTPEFAGIVALINQKLGAAQGNINPLLYRLAGSATTAFHDITTGGNQVPCRLGTPDCPNGGSIGYSAGPGYDLATGLGSVDVSNLVTSWPAPHGANPPTSSPGGTTGSGGTGTPTAPQPITDVEQGGLRTGYLVITPAANSPLPTPTVTYGIVSGGAVQSQAGLTPAPLVTEGFLFADVFPAIGRNLGIAVANSGAASDAVILTLLDSNGKAVGSAVTLTLAPHQQMARFVSDLFPADVIGTQFTGSIHLQGAAPFAALGLRFSGTQFSTLPVVVVSAASGAGAVVVPQFAVGAGWATQVALVNVSGTTISGQIDVRDPSGNPLAVTLDGQTQSSFAYSIAPGASFVLAPRDVNGQTPF